MAANDFLAFATAVGANVVSQADYAASSYVDDGFQSGVADSAKLNKTWRQSAFMSATLAQFIANITGNDVLDNGDLAAMVALLTSSLQIASGIRPAVIEPLSTARAILTSEYAVGFKRVASPAATPASLPAGAAAGQEFVVEDLSGNANLFPITVSPPGGHTLSGLPSFTLNVNRQSQGFRFYGGTTWGLTT